MCLVLQISLTLTNLTVKYSAVQHAVLVIYCIDVK
jgi:hypothetical protein